MLANIAGSPVSGENLYGREAEISDLWTRLQDNQHILMLAPRRVGKTSLMHELRDAPPKDWIVFYSDLEGGSKASDCVADMMAQIASNSTTRNWLDVAKEAIPFRETIAAVFRRVTAVGIEVIRVELKAAMADDWAGVGKQLQKRLAALPAEFRILFIHDELPYLISRILREENGVTEVERLLTWLRTLRQDPDLAGRVSFLVGGSISLSTVLRRYNLSGLINDFSIFTIDPWTSETARSFLEQLGTDSEFRLATPSIGKILALLGEAVPYHVQLLFQEVRQICGGDTTKINDDLIERAFYERLVGPAGSPHLDQQAQRLEHVLAENEVVTARQILDRVSKSEGGTERSSLSDLAPTQSDRLADIVQLLLDDGYLVAEDGNLCFRSNFVREYWRRTHSEEVGR